MAKCLTGYEIEKKTDVSMTQAALCNGEPALQIISLFNLLLLYPDVNN